EKEPVQKEAAAKTDIKTTDDGKPILKAIPVEPQDKKPVEIRRAQPVGPLDEVPDDSLLKAATTPPETDLGDETWRRAPQMTFVWPFSIRADATQNKIIEAVPARSNKDIPPSTSSVTRPARAALFITTRSARSWRKRRFFSCCAAIFELQSAH